MTDSKISDEEFALITDEIEQYCIMKEEIQTKVQGTYEMTKKRMVRTRTVGNPHRIWKINGHFQISLNCVCGDENRLQLMAQPPYYVQHSMF